MRPALIQDAKQNGMTETDVDNALSKLKLGSTTVIKELDNMDRNDSINSVIERLQKLNIPKV